MSSTAERLNNAIVTLDWRAQMDPRVDDGRKVAIGQMASHWLAYWNSADRRFQLVPIASVPKLQRYAEWYAKGWALVPADLRAQLVHPRDLDTSVWAGVEDQLQFMAEGNQAAFKLAQEVAETVAEHAGKGASQLVKGVAIVGGVAVAVLLAVAVAKPRWL
jgi:hypothetical protein